MKKTLIALFALSGIAMAAPTALTLGEGFDRVSAITSSSGSSELTSGRTTLTFDVNGNAEGGTTLENYMLTFQFTKCDNTNTDAFIRLGSLFVRGTDTTGSGGIESPLYVMKGGAAQTNKISDGYLAANTTDTFALTVSPENNVVFLANLSSGEYIAVADLETAYNGTTPNNLTLNSNTGTEVFWTNSGTEQFTFGQVAELTGLTSAQVFKAATTGYVAPEPATATLSLLALAGLASRRRRH